MTFPVYLELGPLSLHPHFVFELLAYLIGFRVYVWRRNKERMPFDIMIRVVSGAIVGATIGSKLLYWLEDPIQTLHNLTNFVYLMQGKTIVGGLLGGLIGVELAKKRTSWTRSTGDEIVLPLVIGMSLGRVGCFLTGLDDHTHGTATTMWSGVDFGDGITRHPTQLYEIGFLLAVLAVLTMIRFTHGFAWEGLQFQLFLSSYLLFRFSIDFIKPMPDPYFGLNNIQVACLLGLIYYAQLIYRKSRYKETIPGAK